MNQATDAVIVEPTAKHTHSIIWLHGLGADGHDFEPIVPVLGLARQNGVRFIFPNAPVQPITVNGGMRMPAWYDVKVMDLKQRQDFDGIQESAELITGYINAEIERGIDSENIILAGFSQGGAMALHVGLRFASTLAGILAISTYLPLEQSLSAEAAEANKTTPILMCHGNADPVIPIRHGMSSAQYLKDLGYKVEWREYDIEHSVALQELVDIGIWIKSVL
jgi:phospholipase/carboxylesterase